MESKCSSCGKSLVLNEKTQNTIMAMLIQLKWGEEPQEEVANLKANLGKYAPVDTNITKIEFRFCYECWLDSLFSAHNTKKKEEQANV